MRITSYIAVFLAVLFFGDRGLSYMAGRIVQKSANQFVRMYRGDFRSDILLLGDSRVDRNISCQKINELKGMTCLNLGLGGNHILISEVLLKDYVDLYGNPHLVVIELSHSTVTPESMGEMRIFSIWSANMSTLAKSIDPTYAMFEGVFKSLRFNDPSFWRLAVEAFREPSTRLLNNRIPPAIIDRWKNGGYVERPIIRKNMEALKRLCRYADEKRIPIRLVISPCWKDFKRAIVNYESWKSALQEAAGGHMIYDYSDAFFEYPEYFSDTIHLNAAGSQHFVKKLTEDGVL